MMKLSALQSLNPFHKPTMTETTLKNVKKLAKPVLKTVKKEMKNMNRDKVFTSALMIGTAAVAATVLHLSNRHG